MNTVLRSKSFYNSKEAWTEGWEGAEKGAKGWRLVPTKLYLKAWDCVCTYTNINLQVSVPYHLQCTSFLLGCFQGRSSREDPPDNGSWWCKQSATATTTASWCTCTTTACVFWCSSSVQVFCSNPTSSGAGVPPWPGSSGLATSGMPEILV